MCVCVSVFPFFPVFLFTRGREGWYICHVCSYWARLLRARVYLTAGYLRSCLWKLSRIPQNIAITSCSWCSCGKWLFTSSGRAKMPFKTLTSEISGHVTSFWTSSWGLLSNNLPLFKVWPQIVASPQSFRGNFEIRFQMEKKLKWVFFLNYVFGWHVMDYDL